MILTEMNHNFNALRRGILAEGTGENLNRMLNQVVLEEIIWFVRSEIALGTSDGNVTILEIKFTKTIVDLKSNYSLFSR